MVSYYNKADYVWTVNQGTANTLRDYGFHKPVEIVPNGTDFVMPQDIAAARRSVEERFRLAPETPLLLFVGQHILQKNLPMLLEGVALYKMCIRDSPYAGKRHRPYLRNMPDVDAIHDVIEHIDNLGRHGGQGQPPKQLAHRLRTQKAFVVLHRLFPFQSPDGILHDPFVQSMENR